MNKIIQPCPCGEIPKELSIAENGQGIKYAECCGDCCGEWSIEFRTNYLDLNSRNLMKLAIKAWNNAPRGIKNEK